LYVGSPTVHAFTETTESLVWTTRDGAFIGVSRDKKKPRAVWHYSIPGSLMAIRQLMDRRDPDPPKQP